MGRFDKLLMTVDFDRTLTDFNTEIPQKNIDAIREFMDEGGLFTVNTGRSIPIFDKFLPDIPLNAPVIYYNGAAIYDTVKNELIDYREIPNGIEILKKVLLDYPKLWTEIQGIDAHYLYSKSSQRERILEQCNTPYKIIKAEETPLPLIKFAFYGSYSDTTVSQFYNGSAEELEYFKRAIVELREKYGDTCDVTRAMPRIIDMQSKDAGKGQAARRLAEILGREILVCAGDAMNDVSMLKEADIAFTPSDCDVEVKEMGFKQTDPCNEGTIYGIVRELKKLF